MRRRTGDDAARRVGGGVVQFPRSVRAGAVALPPVAPDRKLLSSAVIAGLVLGTIGLGAVVVTAFSWRAAAPAVISAAAVPRPAAVRVPVVVGRVGVPVLPVASAAVSAPAYHVVGSSPAAALPVSLPAVASTRAAARATVLPVLAVPPLQVMPSVAPVLVGSVSAVVVQVPRSPLAVAQPTVIYVPTPLAIDPTVPSPEDLGLLGLSGPRPH